ncbi:PREDICTED: unconventional myosin-Ie-like [Ceratosolen solmsi marchali]|uniref:Unconventional myosin-Ie-like n=1 Tax=Ceratosolen solmsi marchali TaxID=326594 RepID=A0AAJ6YI38_9HYME|nr:PREDICTED: unconventional myosin-Ie-like [Ceratosolen solmsi marchali]
MRALTNEKARSAMKEEYVSENISWTPIDYFNNSVVVSLLEEKRPPGLFLILDDVCATLHGGSTGADSDLQKKFAGAASSHAHFQNTSDGFAILHYAGSVSYSVDGFCDKNRDVLFLDLVELMQTSTNSLVREIYPQEREAARTKTLKSRPTTAGSKIRNQASRLVSQLTRCTPHYIRCIKPNETKKPRDWDQLRVKHQVEYLGLKENIRVRRAGFAYRRPFLKFLHRYAILTSETWPIRRGDERQDVKCILSSACIEPNQYQLGRTKLFIKAPESLFMLEEARDRKYNMHARVIQRAFKKYFAKKRQAAQKQEAADLLYGHKQRRRGSLNRNFVGDYIGMDVKPRLASLVGKREKIFYAEVVKKYDRRFKMCRRDLILTSKCLYLIGRESMKKGPKKGCCMEVIKRKLPFEQISHISLSTLQDDFVVIHTREDYASLLELVFKTEFLSVFNKNYIEEMGHSPNIKFNNSIEIKVKKEGWGGGGTRQVKFVQAGYGDKEVLSSSGKILTVSIGPGLPITSIFSEPRMTPDSRTGYDVRPSRAQSGIEQRYVNTAEVMSSNGRPTIPTSRSAFQQPVNAIKGPRPEQIANIAAQRIAESYANINKGPSVMIGNEGKDCRAGSIKAPPPPSEPAPPNQPTIHSAFRLPPLGAATPVIHGNGLQSNLVAARPQPKPRKPQLPSLPKVKALYDYSPQDLDELGLKEGEIIEVLKEHEGGWWHGRLKGRTGLFPSNYVEKI